MDWIRARVLASMFIAVTAAGSLLAQTGYDLFQQALAKERAQGKPQEAIPLYQAVVKGAGADRALAARALVQLAGCYRKLGNVAEAQKTYERILADFSSQAGPVADARAGLAALGAPGASRTAKPLTPVEPVPRRLDLPQSGLPSPDGQYLAIWSEGDLAIRQLTTGNVRKLTTATKAEYPCTFAWSRDSKRLVYSWCYEPGADHKDFAELRVIGIDGNGGRVIYPRSEDALTPHDWSPDGGMIAVWFRKLSDGTFHLAVVSVADGALHDLKSFEKTTTRLETVSFSPDGRHLVYSRPKKPSDPGLRDVVAQPTDGGDERLLLQNSSDNQFLRSDNQFLGWTPSGRGLLFTSNRSGTVDIWLVHVANGRLDDVPVRVKRDVGPLTPRAVTETGGFYYRITDSPGTVSDVYMVSLDPTTGKVASSPTLVSQSVGHSSMPVWSRDGRQLAFKSGAYGPNWPTVSILTLATGEERPLPPTIHMGLGFDWSPDGRFFVMRANPTTALLASEEWGLYRIDARTGYASLITPSSKGAGARPKPKWLPPDGGSIAYRLDMNKIVLRDLEAGKERTIVDAGAFLQDYAFSPDGTSVAFLVARGPNNPKGDIHVAGVPAGRARTLVEYQAPMVPPGCCGEITWSYDSRYVVFSDNTADTFVKGTTTRQAELWRVPATGGRAEKLGLTLDMISQPTVSPDGRRLAFSQGVDRAGFWVLDHFLPAADLARRVAGAVRR